MDNDGDQDILGAAIDLNQIAWFENDATSFSKHIVSNAFGGATCICAKDIDQDGDQDILGAAQFDNRICWWESDLITGFDPLPACNSEQVSVLQSYPNPFKTSTTITCTIPQNSEVTIKKYCDLHPL